MNQQELIPGTNRDHSLSQFFTPPKLAAKLIEWAGGLCCVDACLHDKRVLEPSAGNGTIVRELVKAGAIVHACEIDTRYRDELCDLLPSKPGHRVWCGDDFLEVPTLQNYDLVCGNFPFHLDLDGQFTLHALKFAPRVCAIYPSNFPFSEKRIGFWKEVRPTRIANIARRPWEGATDYVALELVKRSRCDADDMCRPDNVTIEQWTEAWD